MEDLPEVDDLEVAALAAISHPAASTESDSGTEDFSEEEEPSESSAAVALGSPSSKAAAGNLGQKVSDEPLVRLWLQVQGEEHISCTLTMPMEDDGTASSGSDDESEVFDAGQLREFVDAMDNVDADAEDAAASARRMESELFQAQPLDVAITAEDRLMPIGSVTSVLGNMIVIQGQPYGSAVDEGSVVCLGLDEPLGRIQEVFGPVQAPLYALLYAGGTSMPDTLVPGAAVLAVERLSQFVSTDQLRMPEAAATEHDEDDDAVEFSDDEKEAEYRRSMQAEQMRKPSQPGPHAAFSASQRGRAAPRRGGRGGRQGRSQHGRARPAHSLHAEQHRAHHDFASGQSLLEHHVQRPDTLLSQHALMEVPAGAVGSSNSAQPFSSHSNHSLPGISGDPMSNQIMQVPFGMLRQQQAVMWPQHVPNPWAMQSPYGAPPAMPPPGPGNTFAPHPYQQAPYYGQQGPF